LRILRALAGEERITAPQLAESEQIPLQFAYKILKKLQKGGLIRVLRGAEGGCVLSAQLEQVSLYQLMQIMEEDSSVSSCMKPGYQCTWCKAHGDTICKVNVHLTAIQEKLNEELKSYSLSKILFS
jgi:Rrf2 family protein